MSDIFNPPAGDLTTDPAYSANCLNEFLAEIGSYVTGACMIPMNLPQSEIINIINRAKKWFYRNYEYSVVENFLYIPIDIFQTPHFKQRRALTLPDGVGNPFGGGEVYSVYGVFESGGGFGGTSITFQQGDFDMERMLYGGLYGGTGTAEGMENLQYYVINQSGFEMARQITQNPISFHYSQATHEIKFTGQTPKKDVFLELYETIPDCALYGDEQFFDYVAAKVMMSFGQKLAIFNYSLPGNISINADIIQSMGESALDKVIENIKNDEGTDWMMHS
tara:strand:+ start:52 stop:885 length:834 start_codon:yes stop_codon:yes gene_type:complete